MKQLVAVIIPLFLLLSSFDEPCMKKITKKDGSSVTLYYPSCKDSSVYLARIYEHGILVRETWVKDRQPTGVEIDYTADKSNRVRAVTFWDKKDMPFTMSYYSGTSRPEEVTQKISDSVFYNIQYYFNGNVREHGLQTDLGCRFGMWIESDSLGLTKWTGKYRHVEKQEKEEIEGAIVTTVWCFDRDSAWIRTNEQDQVLEKKLYVDGKAKSSR